MYDYLGYCDCDNRERKKDWCYRKCRTQAT
jgi:hypothetical protein